MDRSQSELRVSGKNLEQALEKASQKLGVDSSELEHRVISKTNGGIFAFLAKKIEIAVWPKKSTFQNEKREQRPRKDKTRNTKPNHRSAVEGKTSNNRPTRSEALPELSQDELTSLESDLREFLSGICSRVVGEPVEVTSLLKGERLILNVNNEQLASQVARNTKLAESFEHILRKKPRHLQRELPFRIFVDVQGVRMDRENELADLARDLSEKVSKNKRPIVLNYKSSYDRKIIHMTLDKDERVYTKSIGSGPNRKLMILPSKNKASNTEPSDVDTALMDS